MLLLGGCGGGASFPPVVTAVKVQSLQYGRTASIYIGGQSLRSSMVVKTNGFCSNQSFASSSTTDLLLLNCNVTAVGDFDFSVESAEGQALYSTSLTVPKPQVLVVTGLVVERRNYNRPETRLSAVNKLGQRSNSNMQVLESFSGEAAVVV